MNSKLVVIGAGTSGIAAATKALELGFSNIVILEAENRIGGRICTTPFGKNVVDLGAQWCHGERGNVVFQQISKERRSLLASTSGYKYFNCVRSNKEEIRKDIAVRLQDMMEKILHETRAELTFCNVSLGEFLTNNFNILLAKPENADIDICIAYEFFEFYKKFENSMEACDTLFEVSGKGYLHYWDCEGDPLLNWKDLGYITFLNYLMKATEEKKYGVLQERILLNKKVEEIKWSENNNIRTLITCTDGEQIEADHVICTVSLGVLKENYKTLFTPNLPSSKINAIEGLSFGTVNKIYIEFSKPFWLEDWFGFVMLWDENDLTEIRKRPDNWIEDVFGFFPVDYNDNILCGWITGEKGRKMEMASDSEVLDGCIFLLRKFLNWDITEPVNFKRSSWYKNSNFRGSYSFRSIKTDELNTSAFELSTPILNESGKPILQFAGEATNDHYYSTVHGATETGWREAQRLADICFKKIPKL